MSKILKTPTRPIRMLSPAVLGKPHPLPSNYVPDDPARHPHRVKDGETWYTLEQQYGIPVHQIIEFNFKTTIPDHVNWYLQRITGCNKTTDNVNWAFSDSAEPGIVYIPPKKISFADEGEVMVTRPPRRTPISSWFTPPSDPDNMLDTIGKAIDIITAIDTGLAIASIEMPLVVALGVAALGIVAPHLPGASATLDAINYHIKDARMSGFSQGIVVGAQKKKVSFAKWHFINSHQNNNVAFPNYRKTFVNEYKRAFVAGYFTGLGFTSGESTMFFRHLISHMRPHPATKYGRDVSKWSEITWRNYFIDAAAIFRRLHLK